MHNAFNTSLLPLHSFTEAARGSAALDPPACSASSQSYSGQSPPVKYWPSRHKASPVS